MIVKVFAAVESTCHCESWLEHWKKHSGQRANYCVVPGCGGRPEVGGQVRERGTMDETVYVVPLCRACSDNQGQDITIYDGVNLVPAVIADTCGRNLKEERNFIESFS